MKTVVIFFKNGRITNNRSAGLVDWSNATFPWLKDGFDSRIPLGARDFN